MVWPSDCESVEGQSAAGHEVEPLPDGPEGAGLGLGSGGPILAGAAAGDDTDDDVIGLDGRPVTDAWVAAAAHRRNVFFCDKGPTQTAVLSSPLAV